MAAVLFLFSGAVLAVLQSAFLAILAAVVLLLSVSPFLAPTRYTLTDDDVSETRLGWTRRRRWSELRRFDAGPESLLLSPFPGPSILDRHRGIVLRFTEEQREVVVGFVEERLG